MRERNGYYWDVLAWRNSRKVRLMHYETRAIYREVMDEIWINGGVPNHPDEISSLVGWPADIVLKHWPVIHDCLIPSTQNPDVFTSERLEQERRKRNRIRKIRKKLGQRGGKVSQAKKRDSLQLLEGGKDKKQAIARALVKQESSSAQAIQVTSTSINTYEQRFDVFWSEYPKKVGKAVAKKSFLRLKPSEELQTQILDKIRQFKETQGWKKENGQYIPHPATWLNEGRWDDELPQLRLAAAVDGRIPL